MTRRLFLSVTAAAPLAAAEPWARNPCPEWDGEVTHRLLTDSPWARRVTVPFDYAAPPQPRLRSDFGQIGFPGATWPPPVPGTGWPGGGGGSTGRFPRTTGRAPDTRAPRVRTENYLTIRWSSALPIRQALALEQWGRERLHSAEAHEFLEREPADYLVGISGFSALTLPEGAKGLEEELAKTATLSLKGHRPIRAAAVQVSEHGNHLFAELRFPRTRSIHSDDGFIELAAAAGPMKIARKFKLNAMVYAGRLEL